MSYKRTNKEKIFEALERNDHEAICECAEIAEKVFLNVNYSQANFFSCLLSFLGESFGDEAVRKGLMYVAEYAWKDAYSSLLRDKWKVVDFWLNNYNCATFDFDIEEDEEKLLILINECKTGGKIICESKKIGVSKEPAEWCYNRTDIPYYCSHCKINKEIIPRMLGYDYCEFECGVVRNADGKFVQNPCKMIIYKTMEVNQNVKN